MRPRDWLLKSRSPRSVENAERVSCGFIKVLFIGKRLNGLSIEKLINFRKFSLSDASGSLPPGEDKPARKSLPKRRILLRRELLKLPQHCSLEKEIKPMRQKQ